MNEMQLLEHWRADVQPDAPALLRARRRMLRRALGERPRRAVRVRRVLAGAALAAAVAAAVVVSPVTDDRSGASAAAAEVLARAARSAGAVELDEGEWLHVRSDTALWMDGTARHSARESWVSGEGSLPGRFLDQERHLTVQVRPLPDIATDPSAGTEEILAWLMRDNGDLRGADAAFERAAETLAAHEIPEEFKARLFAAIRLVDGVRVVEESTQFAGYDAVLIGRSEGADYETQLAFDRETGAFIGYQGVLEGQLNYRTVMTTDVVDDLPRRALQAAHADG